MLSKTSAKSLIRLASVPQHYSRFVCITVHRFSSFCVQNFSVFLLSVQIDRSIDPLIGLSRNGGLFVLVLLCIKHIRFGRFLVSIVDCTNLLTFVSYQSIKCRLPPLCPLLYDFSISILRKLFITNTSVSSSGNIAFIVLIDIVPTREFVNVSPETINRDGVKNI